MPKIPKLEYYTIEKKAKRKKKIAKRSKKEIGKTSLIPCSKFSI